MLKRNLFVWTLLLLITAACSSNSDDTTDDTTGDTTDDSTGGATDDDGAVDITINYDVAALTFEIEGNGVQYTKIEAGTTVGSTLNLIDDFGLTVTERVTMDAPFMIFHRKGFVSDPVFYFNTDDNSMTAVTDYFPVTGDQTILGIHPTADHILIFYFLNSEVDADNGWPVYARIYNVNTGVSQTEQLANNFAFRLSTASDGNFAVLHYRTLGLDRFAQPVKISTAELTDRIPMDDPSGSQGFSYSLDNQRFAKTSLNDLTLRFTNLNSGSEGPILNTDAFVGDPDTYFDAEVGDDTMLFRMPMAAPSPFSDLPAQVDLNTGEGSSLNRPLVGERAEPFITDFFDITGYDLEGDTASVVFGVVRGPEGEEGGLVFTTVDADIITTVESDIRFDAVYVIE